MTFDHRLVKFKQEIPNGEYTEDGVYYAICETFYKEDGSIWFVRQPRPVTGCDPDELDWLLSVMKKALDKPFIVYGELDPPDFEIGEENDQ